MSFDLTPQDDELEQQNQAAPAQAGSTPIGPQAGTLLNYSAPAGGKAPGTPTGSGSWTNLQSYLDANQGSGFGQQFTGNLQNQVDSANQSIGSAGKDFQNQVDQNIVQADPNVVNSAVSDPTGFVNDPNNISKWNQQFDANYAGPSSLSDNATDYNSAQTAVGQAQQAANADQSEGGRFALLNKFFGGNGQNYSQGQQSLDNFLLQSDPNVQSGLSNINNQATQLTNTWNQVQTDAQNQASKARGVDEATSNAAHSAIGVDQNGNLLNSGAIPTFQTNLNNQVSTDNTNSLSAYNQVLSDLQSGNITPTEASELGFVASPGSSSFNTYGLDPTQYVQQAGPATLATATSPQQYAQMQALSQLAGNQDTFLPSDSSSAGTYNPNPTASSGFQADYANKANQYNGTLNNTTALNLANSLGMYNNPAYSNFGLNSIGVNQTLPQALQTDASGAPTSQNPAQFHSLQELLNAYNNSTGNKQIQINGSKSARL